MSKYLAELAKVPMWEETALRMVEIIVLKWKRPEIEARCAELIIKRTNWPFKLVVYDNRPNTPNTARIWNKLIAAATCPFVCVIDSDVFVEATDPCWLTRMMRTFDEHADCRLVVPMTDRCSSKQQRALVAPDKYPSAVRDDSEWSGFCFLTRKTVLGDVGWFDEDFVGYGQDSEFSVRLARHGGGTYVRRDVWMQHLHGASFNYATGIGEHNAAADREYAQRLFLEKTKT